jgi:hypothetical protein
MRDKRIRAYYYCCATHCTSPFYVTKRTYFHIRKHLSLSCKVYVISPSHYVHIPFGFTFIDSMVQSDAFTERVIN